MMLSVGSHSFSKLASRPSFLTPHKVQITLLVSRRMSSSSPATADLCDKYVTSPSRLTVANPGFNDYGGRIAFHGPIETIRCFESNPLVRKTLSEPGNGRVLVVDGGGSYRVAILGDELASLAEKNGWSGLVINGCIRDSQVIKGIPVGVKALSTHPLKSVKTHWGEKNVTVAFAGVEFVPGQWVYADAVSRSRVNRLMICMGGGYS
jgi:regulator of ribonuclease activity A